MIRSLARARAIRRNEAGRALMDAGDLTGAAAAYAGAVRLDPALATAWFNLGLVHKWRREWADAVRCNLAALGESGEPGDPAWWNLGIAATALRDWETARRAWRGFGVDVPDGDGEIEMGLGLVPIRIAPHTAPEVVWCERLDPARGRIENVPFPESGRRWHDVVLHDGEPTGERLLRGRPVPVFDELELWARAPWPTTVVEVVADEAAVDDLRETAEGAGWAAQDWTASVRMLCDTCSLGAPGHEHDPAEDAGRRDRRLGIAAPPADVPALLAAWAARDDGVTYGDPVTG
ncbi:MAG TPA: tetratricopeptide repeat protein [Mycobacteriales bacterium]|nr:tetratricopeptide repeat protein [Mycobacteriales bacterium]